ncbi:PTS mannitol transporter subunit IIBC [Cryobacterium zongtaii]|uniref:PTS system mannitol-specific EIICB component n=1 Tax=Cryobacterium zongtaii TaxID=1259217 RepID=A0A2S3Z9R6_9MICO|nr:PTS mannitol transporter subunit IICB [Cryobacterium zongtaii]POH62284.1 PTS mannitol transporter subunit IIBC [Cryobacterium zongtaii]
MSATPTTTKPLGGGVRARIQAFGGFLTAMVIPNVGAFIAWGFVTALFIPTGWMPNEEFAQLVGPMISYMLPLLIAFTGGRLVHGARGGVIGAVGTIGLIVGAGIPMFLGAMIMGPLSAYLLKRVDRFLEPRMRAGLEMLVNNFSLGILGFGLCLLSFAAIGPGIEELNKLLLAGINALVATGVLPLLALLNEPAKVLFLNNVIDQGVYYPLGLQQAATQGKSIFFMVASNPGPGLGLLTAFLFFSKSKLIRRSTPSAILIHFIGGIHEIYFPYVLMKPLTIVGMIAGAASGIATFSLFDVGLVAGPSPGSIVSYLLLTPRGNYLGVLTGVLVAAIVTFVVTAAILKFDRFRSGSTLDEEDEGLEAAQNKSSSMKAEGRSLLAGALTQTDARPTSIVFACDAGMGSSAMGASVFRKRLTKAGITGIAVTHAAIENIPIDTGLAVIQQNLVERARRVHPHLTIIPIANYLGDPALDELQEKLAGTPAPEASQDTLNG